MTNEIAKIIPQVATGISLSDRGAIVLRNIGEAAAFAELMQSGGMLPPKVTPAFATVAIIAGLPLGLTPFESVQNFAVINNRPALFGDGMKAVVLGSGLLESESVEWFTNKDKKRRAVRVTVRRKGVKDPIIGEFSEEMARTAGLWGKQGPWTQYPERMLLARARAFAYRDGFADILKGVRSAEEERDLETIERGEAGAEGATPRRVRRTTRATAGEIIEADAEIIPDAPKAIEAPSAEVETPADAPAPEVETVPAETPPAKKEAPADGAFLLP